MKQWFAALIDDLKFLGAECKREFSDLEIPEVQENLNHHEAAYVPYTTKVPGTHMFFYRDK